MPRRNRHNGTSHRNHRRRRGFRPPSPPGPGPVVRYRRDTYGNRWRLPLAVTMSPWTAGEYADWANRPVADADRARGVICALVVDADRRVVFSCCIARRPHHVDAEGYIHETAADQLLHLIHHELESTGVLPEGRVRWHGPVEDETLGAVYRWPEAA